MSRDPKRTGSLAKLTGTDILRACNRSWNDDRCPIRGAYDAACGDANVQVYDRTKRRCYRLNPQPALAKASLSVPLRFSSPRPGRCSITSTCDGAARPHHHRHEIRPSTEPTDKRPRRTRSSDVPHASVVTASGWLLRSIAMARRPSCSPRVRPGPSPPTAPCRCAR